MEIVLDHLWREAKEARRSFEDGSVNKSQLGVDYVAYNPSVVDVSEFLAHAAELFPNLNCGLASVYLLSKIRHGQIVNGSYDGQVHTFFAPTGNPEECIMDFTADQFGGPEIYVGPLIEPWSLTRGLTRIYVPRQPSNPTQTAAGRFHPERAFLNLNHTQTN